MHVPICIILPSCAILRLLANADTAGLYYEAEDMWFGRRGAPEDKVRALGLFLQAGEAGDADAEEMLARIHMYGAEDIDKDPYEAFNWAAKAARKDKLQAMEILARLYLTGEGVPDMTEKDRLGLSVHWYTKAAEQGNLPAMNDLGDLYRMGKGVAKDPKMAVQWYTRATKAFNDDMLMMRPVIAKSYNSLGALTYQGSGTKQNITLAKEWFSKAVVFGHAGAKTNLEQLSKQSNRKPKSKEL